MRMILFINMTDINWKDPESNAPHILHRFRLTDANANGGGADTSFFYS